LPIALIKSPELHQEKNNEKNNSNNNMTSKSFERIKSAIFKIFYDYNKHIYYLMDLGVGYGTFYKIEEETIIKENSIVNIGESFLVFSFMNKELETEEQFGEDDLILKIYSNNQEYDPIAIQNCDRVYQVGRSDKCDIYIKDRMLSRIHCLLICILKMEMKIIMKVLMVLGCLQMKKLKLKMEWNLNLILVIFFANLINRLF